MTDVTVMNLKLTEDSMRDNIRPIMPKGNSKYRVLPWLSGSKKNCPDYDFDVVGKIRVPFSPYPVSIHPKNPIRRQRQKR
jgi:hypothetical protein